MQTYIYFVIGLIISGGILYFLGLLRGKNDMRWEILSLMDRYQINVRFSPSVRDMIRLISGDTNFEKLEKESKERGK